jgi:hypothetical protein
MAAPFVLVNVTVPVGTPALAVDTVAFSATEVPFKDGFAAVVVTAVAVGVAVENVRVNDHPLIDTGVVAVGKLIISSVHVPSACTPLNLLFRVGVRPEGLPSVQPTAWEDPAVSGFLYGMQPSICGQSPSTPSSGLPLALYPKYELGSTVAEPVCGHP